MPSRSGTRVLDPRQAIGWLREDLGEDWVVPRSEVRYLVARRIATSVLLTAIGSDGQLLGERLFADRESAGRVMTQLREDGLVEAWRDIPDGLPSATRFLAEPIR